MNPSESDVAFAFTFATITRRKGNSRAAKRHYYVPRCSAISSCHIFFLLKAGSRIMVITIVFRCFSFLDLKSYLSNEEVYLKAN